MICNFMTLCSYNPKLIKLIHTTNYQILLPIFRLENQLFIRKLKTSEQVIF
jgi:hypothetical protein